MTRSTPRADNQNILRMEVKGRMLPSATQSLDSSANITDTSAHANGTDTDPFKEAKAEIARTESTCETLRQGIDTMQRGLEKLAGIVGGLKDCEAREKLLHQLDSMNKLLSLRLDQLSSIDRLLQVALDRARRPE
ncbi:hypothetical protein [Bradyrhizobium sp. AUGA SZCCT0431]|uniref:hypothetical protein n=1 Tax=Bradyrhizobium sp. AUGA SZCCT0431 TaxID=2807674 RepID=UPI001BA8A2DB|nr:hypothetical protein [Bradyrhizobium sp. AUGA SZCCT0431]MBR1146490.1 hypothetical protein [Bradyrhizobium sp. AUGA SZCCT0431]